MIPRGAYAVTANPITIEGDDPRGSISLTVNQATVASVLEQLRSKFGFNVEGAERLQSEPVSLRADGPLPAILERLLRNWNYVIVKAKESPSGIGKVLIINSDFGSGAPKPSPVAPAPDESGVPGAAINHF